jgi:hypothetical protein
LARGKRGAQQPSALQVERGRLPVFREGGLTV